jgi:hypothetical protein
MTAIGMDSELSILPAKVTIKDDNPMEIVTAENVTGDEWKQKLHGDSYLEQYTVVATKLAFNAPWHALILSPGIE